MVRIVDHPNSIREGEAPAEPFSIGQHTTELAIAPKPVRRMHPRSYRHNRNSRNGASLCSIRPTSPIERDTRLKPGLFAMAPFIDYDDFESMILQAVVGPPSD